MQYNSFENTVGKGEVTSNFSFTRSVFYPVGELSTIFIKLKIVVCKHFQFESLKFVVWERVKSLSYTSSASD